MHLSWNEIRVRAAGFVQEWWNTVRNYLMFKHT